MIDAQIQPIKEGEVISLEDAIAQAAANPRLASIATGSPGVDWILGGGIPPAIGILLASPPGAGKTTLIIELLRKLAQRNLKALYVASEETTEQLGRRFGRLGKMPPKLRVVATRQLDDIEEIIRNENPKVAAIDSLHKVAGVCDDNDFTYSTGSNAALTLAADRLRALSSEVGCATISIAHVSKEGGIAGANTLQHDQDIILYLNGKQQLIDGRPVIVGVERTLRCDGKSRYIETGRCARLQMLQDGLHDRGPWVDERPPWEVFDTNMKGAS